MRRSSRAERRQRQSVQVAQGGDIPAPTRGWNAQDPIARMKPGDAYQLDNWICRAGYIEIRKGFAEQVIGFDNVPESFLPYRAGASEELFCVSDGEIYDVTSSGALGAALVSGLTNSRFESINIANDAGVFMLLVNGADTPRKYDGSSFSTTSISGTVGSITLDPTKLINLMLHKRRVFLQERESLRVWYLDVNAIAGTAGLLDLGPVFSEGGSLVGMGVWSGYNSDSGPDAVAAFVTDQGQVAVFRGNDPADANDWFHVGTYAIGKPLGRRAVVNKDSELVIITHDGAVPLSVAMRADRDTQRSKAITARIQNAFSMAAASHGSKFGWEARLYPTGQLTIINVPLVELGRAVQFVQSQTGGWCRFTGINAVSWAYVNDQIFFAGVDDSGNKGVFRWDTGGSDNGAAIQCECISAFHSFGSHGLLKEFTMIRPVIRAGISLRPYVEVLVDYKITQPSNVPETAGTTGGGVWGEGLWGVAVWTSAQPLRLEWTAATGLGYVAAARIRVIANPPLVSDAYPAIRCELIEFNLLYTRAAAF